MEGSRGADCSASEALLLWLICQNCVLIFRVVSRLSDWWKFQSREDLTRGNSAKLSKPLLQKGKNTRSQCFRLCRSQGLCHHHLAPRRTAARADRQAHVWP